MVLNTALKSLGKSTMTSITMSKFLMTKFLIHKYVRTHIQALRKIFKNTDSLKI